MPAADAAGILAKPGLFWRAAKRSVFFMNDLSDARFQFD